MFLEVRLDGADVLERRLAMLGRKMERKLIRQAVRASLRPVLRGAKANARSMVGGDMGSKIARNLVLRAFKKRRKGVYGMSMRLKSENEGAPPDFVHYTAGSASSMKSHKQVTGKRYFVPAAIEYGHAFAGRGGRKNPPKDIKAIPYMRSAADVWLPWASTIIGYKLRTAIEAEFAEKRLRAAIALPSVAEAAIELPAATIELPAIAMAG